MFGLRLGFFWVLTSRCYTGLNMEIEMTNKPFRVIQGGREEMGQQALSAILRRDTPAFDKLMSKMQPRPPSVTVISGAAGTTPSEPSVPGQRDADKT